MKKSIQSYKLAFIRPSGTSRGVLLTKDSVLIAASVDNQIKAIGEASYLVGLNPEPFNQLPSLLEAYLKGGEARLHESPAVSFGVEMFEQGLRSKTPFSLFDNAFTSGTYGIPINGLVWMGAKSYMLEQIRTKIEQQYRCIKIKVGAIAFQEELDLLQHIRREYKASDIEIRLDANGAFEPRFALDKLAQMSDFQIHSIEQPIKPGQMECMEEICEKSPIPIALDEELISITDREALLRRIRPKYIILKPSLLGGWAATKEWITTAESLQIGWWVTSALESNIGLNAISQWVGGLNTTMPQGLGTGQLFSNNIDSPLVIKDAKLFYDPSKKWNHPMMLKILDLRS